LRGAKAARRLALAGGGAAALKTVSDRLAGAAEKRYPPEGRFVAVDGVRLHCVDRGTGTPVVFLHGLRGSSRDFTATVLDAVAERHRAVAFDRPGSGYSERPQGDGASPIVQARLLRSAFAELRLVRPVIVAHSLGAAAALALAALHPESAGGVVLLGPHAIASGAPLGAASLIQETWFLGPTLLHTVVEPLGHALAGLVLRRSFSPNPVPPDYRRMAPAMALRPTHFLWSSRDLRAADDALRAVEPLYRTIAAPVTILVGEADRVVGTKESRELAHLIPRAELVELPGCGHMVMFAAPDAVVSAIERVVARRR
jgi:pimeloyl-ACP methyl ester carboxylesterase